MKKKKIILSMVFVLTATLLMAGGGGQQAAPAASGAQSTSASGSYLPLTPTPVTLKMFIEMDQNKIGVHTVNYSDMLCFQELAKKTNVTIDFIHPPAGMAAEQLNLMMAAGDMQDITYWNWSQVSGGPTKLIDDNIILPLNKYINSLPNYQNFLKANPSIDKDVKTDDGIYYCFPLIQKSEDFKNVFGFMIRKDWLDKLGLPVPETIDEWYTTMVAFRDKDPDGTGKKITPLVSIYAKGIEELGQDAVRSLYSAWGKSDSFYVNNGKVFFGAYEPEYKEYLLTMLKWITEGLIEPNFPTMDIVQLDSAILNSTAGICREGLGTGLDKYYAGFNKRDDIIVALPFPVLKKGDQAYNFIHIGRDFASTGGALSPNGKNNDLAAKWMDYLFSDEAGLLLNFGIEGRTYNWINGFPQLVDSIYNNPTESVNVALGRYAIGVTGFIFVNDVRVREQRMLRTKNQREGLVLWNKADITCALPPITYTANESQELARILSEANTLVKEYTLSFLLGRRDINREFDTYINTLKSMNIERAIAINQAAVDRYNKR